jgi:hypothetical protein
LDNSILDRFCLEILPKVRHKNKWLHRIFKNQITTLNIRIAENKTIIRSSDIMNILCTSVLTKSNNLICLKFHSYFDSYLEELFLNLPIDRDAHELFIDVLNSFLNSFIKFVHYLMCFIKSFFYLIWKYIIYIIMRLKISLKFYLYPKNLIYILTRTNFNSH